MEILKTKIIKYFNIKENSINDIIYINDITIVNTINDLIDYDIEYVYDETDDIDKNIVSIIYYFYGLYFKKNYNPINIEYYFKYSSQLGNNKAMHKLALYYKSKNDYDNMMKYYKLAIDNNNYHSLMRLSRYLLKSQKINEAIYFYLMATKFDKIKKKAFHNLAYCYSIINDTENMIKYYSIASELGNYNSMISLAKYYEEINEIESMIKFYKMAIIKNNHNHTAMYNLGIYYKNINDYDNMLKYFHMAFDLDNFDAVILLIDYYKEKYDIVNLFLCYDKMITLGNYKYIKKLNNVLHLNFSIDLAIKYKNYLNHKNLHKLNKKITFYFQIKKYIESFNESSIEQTLNKLKVKRKLCYICYDKQYVVYLKCNHYVCFECYEKIFDCPICRSAKK